MNGRNLKHLSLSVLCLTALFSGSVSASQKKSGQKFRHMADHVKRALSSVVSIQAIVKDVDEVYSRIGTGFVYGKDGFVVTRTSVVQSGDSVVVTLPDGRCCTAWFVHEDVSAEITLLKLPFDNVQPIPIGKSNKLTVKSPVALIGNSMGIFPSVTLGTYSGKRSDGMLHLVAMVPPGNGGSPVLNERGLLVGILAGRVLSDNEIGTSVENVGLALPVERVDWVIKDVLRKMKKAKGWVGISVLNLQAAQFGKGVRVIGLSPSSPALEAGICRGDTIVTFNERPVREADTLAEWVKQTAPGQVVKFVVLKNKQEITFPVEVQPKPWDRR